MLDISVSWTCDNCYSYSTVMYALDNMGANRAPSFFLTRERASALGAWTLSGSGCCAQ